MSELERMGTDGVKWAKEFIRTVTENESADPCDVDFMVGWFANAIEAGRSAEQGSGVELLVPTDAAKLRLTFVRGGSG